MATRHTGGEAQEDSDTDLSEQGDRTDKGPEKEVKSVRRKFLHSKAVRRMTGRRLGADVTPAKKVQLPPAHVQAPTAKRTSDTVQQPPKHSQERDDQQMMFQVSHPPPPEGQHHKSDPRTQSPGTTQPRRPGTSPQQTHPTAGSVLCEQPRHPGYSDPPHSPKQSIAYDHLQQRAAPVPYPHHTYLEDEQEEDHCHGDPASNDQQLRRLEFENTRLKREKDMVEKTMLEYEAQLAAKDEEIIRMRKVRTEPLYRAIQGVTSDQTKLEISLVARDAKITQLTADKNLLEHELQELQTKYKSLVTERDAAIHQVETVTHQWRTAQKMNDSMKEKYRTLTEKLQRMGREEERSLQERQQKDKIKQLEDELRGLAAVKQASEEALRKQVQNNQEHYEQLLYRAQTKEDEDKQLRQELLNVQSQLKDSTVKVTVLEQTKQLLLTQLDESKRNLETELRNKLQEEKAQSHTTQQQLRQELETLQREQQQKILAAKIEAGGQFAEKYREKKMKYKNKIEALEQEVFTMNIEIRKYETRLADLEQQLVTMYQQLMAARESASCSSRQVIELTEEKRRIVNSYEIKLVEEKRSMEEYVAQLQQQKESQQQTEEPSKTDKRKLADTTEQLEHEKTAITTLQQHLMESEQEVAHLSQELEQKKSHVSELRQQVATLQQLVRQNNGSTTTIDSVKGLSKEKERGRGCYGAVYEVRVNGFPCIAKRLHDILVGRKGMEPVGDEQRTAVISRFRSEGDILSCLRHPNIVQMLGVHCGSDEADISLIMEYMHMDLERCMKTYPDIPLPYKTSILRDVAYGLAYLHSKAIIHRDLNAGNVLLTEALRAKIADLGMSKLFDKKVVMQQTKTTCPGALDFMPPESLTKAPKYSDKLDIFSFGHLTVFLVNQEEPHVDDNSLAPGDVARKQVQFGKRREALDQMSHQLGCSRHPLYSTVVQCLSDTPDQRPTSRDLVKRMEEICQQHPIPHKNTLETLTEVATLRSSSKEQEETLKEMKQYDTQLKSSNQVLQSRLVATKKESSELQQQCGTLQQELELVRGQYRELEEENVSSNQVLRTYCTDMQAMLQQMETQLGPIKSTTHYPF